MDEFRHLNRGRVVELLYQLEITGKELDSIISYAEPIVDKQQRDVVQKVWEKRDTLDGYIVDTSKEWRLQRIGYVERNILRLALFEIKYSNTPTAVAINEAVEIAKLYSGEEAGRFVNGVLGRIVREANE